MERGIVINEKNRPRIEEMIKKGQGKARVRTIDFSDIEYTVQKELKRFQTYGVSMKNRSGVIVSYCPSAQNYPDSYSKYGGPKGTFFDIRYTEKGASLIKVYRYYCDRPSSRRKVYLTQKCKDALINGFCKCKE